MAQHPDMQQGAAPPKAPLSTHPAFPLIVGLWFAALLGLGTIVLPAAILEKAAGLIGLSAHAPLTLGARVALAFVAAMLGLVGGLLLARRFAETRVVARTPRRRTPLGEGRVAPPRPLSVHDELGEDAIAPTVQEQRNPLPSRRRALAILEDRPDDVPLAAPVPGSEIESPPELPADEPDLSNTVTEADAPEPYVPALDTRKPRDFANPSPSESAEEPLEPLTLEPIDAPLEDLGMVQLAERLGRSMQRLSEAKLPDPEPDAESPEFSPPSLEHGEPEALTVPPPVVPDALRAFMDSPPEEFTSPPRPVDEQDPAEVPAPIAPTAFQPFDFDAFQADEDDEDEMLDQGPFTLPLTAMAARPFDAPAAAETDAETLEDQDDDDEAVADESYSSLLSMKHPFRLAEDLARIDEPEDAAEPAEAIEPDEGEPATPASVARPFDALHQPVPTTDPVHSRAAPDPVETERALRSALVNLQRMSGAA